MVGEAGAHYLVEFGCREMGEEGADEHSAFALANEGEAAATTASAPETRMDQKKKTANLPMNHWRKPMWYRSWTSATKKMMAGMTVARNQPSLGTVGAVRKDVP